MFLIQTAPPAQSETTETDLLDPEIKLFEVTDIPLTIDEPEVKQILNRPTLDENKALLAFEQLSSRSTQACILAANIHLAKKNPQRAKQFYQQAANAGHPYAQWVVASSLINSKILFADTQQKQKACAWAYKAAQGGLAVAMRLLAYRHLSGHGVEVNITQSIQWCDQAVQQNEPLALALRAAMHLVGIGGDVSHISAYDLFTKLAANKSYAAYGEFYLAFCQRYGYGTPINEVSCQWLLSNFMPEQRRFCHGDKWVTKPWIRGVELIGDIKGILENAQPAALPVFNEIEDFFSSIAGNPDFQAKIAGTVDSASEKKTVEPTSMSELAGAMALLRQGSPKYPEAAAKLKLLAEAKNADSNAQAVFGILHIFGHGVDKSPNAAVEWFRKGAKEKSSKGDQAKFLLAFCLYRGLGTTKNSSWKTWIKQICDYKTLAIEFPATAALTKTITAFYKLACRERKFRPDATTLFARVLENMTKSLTGSGIAAEAEDTDSTAAESGDDARNAEGDEGEEEDSNAENGDTDVAEAPNPLLEILTIAKELCSSSSAKKKAKSANQREDGIQRISAIVKAAATAQRTTIYSESAWQSGVDKLISSYGYTKCALVFNTINTQTNFNMLHSVEWIAQSMVALLRDRKLKYAMHTRTATAYLTKQADTGEEKTRGDQQIDKVYLLELAKLDPSKPQTPVSPAASVGAGVSLSASGVSKPVPVVVAQVSSAIAPAKQSSGFAAATRSVAPYVPPPRSRAQTNRDQLNYLPLSRGASVRVALASSSGSSVRAGAPPVAPLRKAGLVSYATAASGKGAQLSQTAASPQRESGSATLVASLLATVSKTDSVSAPPPELPPPAKTALPAITMVAPPAAPPSTNPNSVEFAAVAAASASGSSSQLNPVAPPSQTALPVSDATAQEKLGTGRLSETAVEKEKKVVEKDALDKGTEGPKVLDGKDVAALIDAAVSDPEKNLRKLIYNLTSDTLQIIDWKSLPQKFANLNAAQITEIKNIVENSGTLQASSPHAHPVKFFLRMSGLREKMYPSSDSASSATRSTYNPYAQYHPGYGIGMMREPMFFGAGAPPMQPGWSHSDYRNGYSSHSIDRRAMTVPMPPRPVAPPGSGARSLTTFRPPMPSPAAASAPESLAKDPDSSAAATPNPASAVTAATPTTPQSS